MSSRAPPGGFFQTPGGTLGIAFPGAIGVRLAYPERTVIGFGGDGGATYTLPALWTAAHYRVGAKFVLCHNRSYRLLKNNLVAYWRERNVNSNEFPAAFDIDDPVLDYVSLAKGLGVPGTRVARPAEIAPAIRQMLDHQFLFFLFFFGKYRHDSDEGVMPRPPPPPAVCGFPKPLLSSFFPPCCAASRGCSAGPLPPPAAPFRLPFAAAPFVSGCFSPYW